MKNDATVAAHTGDPPDKQILFELSTEFREIAFADKCPFTSTVFNTYLAWCLILNCDSASTYNKEKVLFGAFSGH